MAGSSDALRGVRFQTASAEKPAGKEEKRGLCRRLRSLFGRGHEKEPERIVFEAPKKEGAKAAPAPFVIAEPDFAATSRGTAAPMVFEEPKDEVGSFIDSLPNGCVREDAEAAVRRAYGDTVPTLEQAKEALVCDTGGECNMQDRRGMLFALAFGGRQNGMMKTGALENSETINVFYYSRDPFSNMVTMLIGQDEGERLRAKSEDRMAMLQAMEKVLLVMPRAERIDGFVLMAGIAMKLKETLGTKEVCIRMGSVFGIMAALEGSRLDMLSTMHANVSKLGVRPSGRDMNSGVPRADREEASRWIAGRPQGGVMNAAALAWEKNKPQGYSEFMRMLEEDTSDTENRRLHVLEEVVGEWAGGECKGYHPATTEERAAIAWNVGYFCVADIKEVANFAKGMKDEEEVRLAVLDKILWVARRMPPGRRMEAPGLMANAARKLIAGDEQLGLKPKFKEWVVTDWLDELVEYMKEPDAEIAYKRLSWVPLDPMKVVNYIEKRGKN